MHDARDEELYAWHLPHISRLQYYASIYLATSMISWLFYFCWCNDNGYWGFNDLLVLPKLPVLSIYLIKPVRMGRQQFVVCFEGLKGMMDVWSQSNLDDLYLKTWNKPFVILLKCPSHLIELPVFWGFRCSSGVNWSWTSGLLKTRRVAKLSLLVIQYVARLPIRKIYCSIVVYIFSVMKFIRTTFSPQFRMSSFLYDILNLLLRRVIRQCGCSRTCLFRLLGIWLEFESIRQNMLAPLPSAFPLHDYFMHLMKMKPTGETMCEIAN